MSLKDILLPLFLDPKIQNKSSGSLDYGSVARFWQSLNSSYQPFYSFLVIYCLSALLYLSVGFVFAVIEQKRWLEKWRINKEHKTMDDYIKCLKNLFLNMAILIPICLILGWPLLTKTMVDVNAPIEEFPAWYTILWQIIAALYIEDFVHYVLHRILHNPLLYKKIHKRHHEFQITFALAGNYAHPLETIILSICTFISLPLLRMHLFTFYLWIAYRWVDAAFEHCGYDIVPHILPFAGGVPFHDYHHTTFNYNFGSRFTFWDKLLGTYSDKTMKTDQANKSEKKSTGQSEAKNTASEKLVTKKRK